jgi:hypothetical protein
MFLKDVESWLKRGQYVRFFKGDMPPKKCTPNIGANIGAITGILLRLRIKFISLLLLDYD